TNGANITTGTWYHVAVSGTAGGQTTVRLNGQEVLSYVNDNDGAMGTNFTLGDLRSARGINFDGRLDEIRFSTVTRTQAWQDATYRNQATTSSFYSVGSVNGGYSRSFNETNVTVAGNLTIEEFTDVMLPNGTLGVGGSFNNNGAFGAASGTIEFNSTAD